MIEVAEATDAFASKARDQVWRQKKGVNPFDDFGREAQRLFFTAQAPRGQVNHLSAEFQDCFGHSLVEVLKAPEDDLDVLAVTGGLRDIGDRLRERGIVSAFGFAPSDDIGLATAYCAAGFRKTGLLAGGIQSKGERKDAILWTRKLMNPGEEDS